MTQPTAARAAGDGHGYGLLTCSYISVANLAQRRALPAWLATRRRSRQRYRWPSSGGHNVENLSAALSGLCFVLGLVPASNARGDKGLHGVYAAPRCGSYLRSQVLSLASGTVWRVGVCDQPKLDCGDLWVGYMGPDAKIRVQSASGGAQAGSRFPSYLRRPSLCCR